MAMDISILERISCADNGTLRRVLGAELFCIINGLRNNLAKSPWIAAMDDEAENLERRRCGRDGSSER